MDSAQVSEAYLSVCFVQLPHFLSAGVKQPEASLHAAAVWARILLLSGAFETVLRSVAKGICA